MNAKFSNSNCKDLAVLLPCEVVYNPKYEKIEVVEIGEQDSLADSASIHRRKKKNDDLMRDFYQRNVDHLQPPFLKYRKHRVFLLRAPLWRYGESLASSTERRANTSIR